MKPFLALAFAVASIQLTPLLRAEGLDKARIPADARWFAHVDVEALAKSELYAALAASGDIDVGELFDDLGDGEGKGGLAELGIEPMRDLKSLTVYSVGAKSEQTVVLLTANASVDRAIEKLKAHAEYRSESFEGHTLHAWGDEKSAWYASVWRREGSDDRLVIQSDDKASLKRAFDVLAGKAPSLSSAAVSEKDGSPSALRASPATGSIVFAVATTPLGELAGIDAASNVARLAQDMVLDVGETHGELFATLAIEAKDTKEARQVQQVLQGAVALLGLISSSDEGPKGHGGGANELGSLQDFASAFQFRTAGKTMHVEFRMSVALLLQDLKKLDSAGDDDEDEEK